MVASFDATTFAQESPRAKVLKRWFQGARPSADGAISTIFESSGEEQTPLLSMDDAWQEPSWNDVVIQLGQDIRALRAAQSVTLEQLHAQTKVPMYHLLALEAGQLEKMPEAIFVRGFLKHICTALGEDGAALLAKLPDSAPSSAQGLTLFPPQPKTHQNQIHQISAAHLYVGYAALLAGSVGGLAWMEQSAATRATVPEGSTQVQQNLDEQMSPKARVQQSLEDAARSSTSASPEQLTPEFS